MKAIIFSLVLMLTVAGAANAKELYVDAANGNDNVSYANNSQDSPWASLGRAVWGATSRGNSNSSEAARAGDTVHVAAGTYVTGEATNERYIPIYNPINNGSSGNPITIVAEGPVRLESPDAGSGQPIIGAYDREFITWDGFILDEQNILTTPDTGPVVVWSSNDITIQNLQIHGMNRGWTDNHNGIRLERVDRITIRGNRISGYRESQNGENASGLTMYRANAVVIENNEIYNTNAGVFVKGLNVGPITIRRNHIHDVQKGIIFGGIGTSAGSNGARAYQNVITGAWSGISFLGYDNVSPSNVYVVNNTIADGTSGADGGAILFRPGSDGYNNLNIRNNLIVNGRSGLTAWHSDLSQIETSHNAYYNNGRVADIEWNGYSLSQYQSRFGKGDGSLQTNPQLEDLNGGNFRPLAGSPLIDAGVDVLDLNGDGSTSDPITIGAYITGAEEIGLGGNIPDAPRNVSVQRAD